MSGNSSSNGGGGGPSSSAADKFLSAFKDSLKKFPFDPVCGPAKPAPSSLISIMSSSGPMVGNVGADVASSSGSGGSGSASSSSGGGASGCGITASGGGGSGGRVLDRLLPSSSPLSIVQSKSSSSTDDAIASRMANVSMQWPTFSSFTDQLEAVAGEYLTAISVGAALGAAVAAGIGMGCVAASGLTSGVRIVVPTFWYGVVRTRIWIYEYLFGKQVNDSLESGERLGALPSTDATNCSEDEDLTPRISNHQAFSRGQSPGEEISRRDSCMGAKATCLGSGESKIYVIRGDVVSSPAAAAATLAEDQCRQCLDSLLCELGKKLMGLQHVRRLTVYLVTGSCEASTFRSILTKEYPVSLNDLVLSIMYVQRLETDGAAVQVEALASL